MKRSLFLSLLLAPLVALAQAPALAPLDTTTLTLIPTTSAGWATITNVCTNAPLTVMATNVQIGALPLDAYGTINSNFQAVADWMAANGAVGGTVTNFYLDGVVAGLSSANEFSAAGQAEIMSWVTAAIASGAAITNLGGVVGGAGSNTVFTPGGTNVIAAIAAAVSGTNNTGAFIPQNNGSGSNLTISNTVTIVSTNPFYSIAAINLPALTTLSNYTTGWLFTDGGTTATNPGGYTTVTPFPPRGGNSGGPTFPATNFPVSFPVNTNTNGWITVTNATCTNTAGPYTLAVATNNLNIFTNACGFVFIGVQLCPNQNGPYYAATNWGGNAFTNQCGYVLYLKSMATNYYTQVASIAVTSGNNEGLFSPLSSAGVIFTNYTVPTNNGFVVVNCSNSRLNGHYSYAGCAENFIIGGLWLAFTNDTTPAIGSARVDPGVLTNKPWTGPIVVSQNIYSFSVFQYLTNITLASNVFDTNLNIPGTPGNSDLSYQYVTYNSVSNITVAYFYQQGGVYGSSAAFLFSSYYPYSWAFYGSNSWNFYEAPAATYNSSNESVTAVSGYTNYASVTNVTMVPPILTTNDNAGNTVVFTTTNVGGYYISTNGTMNYFGSQPGTNLAFVICPPTTNGPGRNTWYYAPPIVVPGPAPTSCPEYVSCVVGGRCKTLLNGLDLWRQANTVNTATRQQTSYLNIDTNGLATLVVCGQVVLQEDWTSSFWQPSEIPGSCELCNQRAYPLPSSFY